MTTPVSVIVALDPPYEVRIGPGVLDEVSGLVDSLDAGVFTIADRRAFELHGPRLGDVADMSRELLPAGEEQKRFEVVERLLDALAQARVDRGGIVVAFGGGVCGDLAGFVASLYMRGIACVQCPTTLLAQVDAAVGGKTAVNLAAGKNLAGTFHQPLAVFADTNVLQTLDEEDYRSGLGEILKTAMINGPLAVAELSERATALAARDPDALADVIARSVGTKARIVALDPTETGSRRALNLGHTFAHAIEHAAGYGRVPHGVAVAIGIDLALRASQKSGCLLDAELPERVAELTGQLGLPSDLAALGLALEPEHLRAAMRNDKKGRAGRPRFVLVAESGRLALDAELDDALVDEVLAESLRGDRG